MGNEELAGLQMPSVPVAQRCPVTDPSRDTPGVPTARHPNALIRRVAIDLSGKFSALGERAHEAGYFRARRLRTALWLLRARLPRMLARSAKVSSPSMTGFLTISSIKPLT